MGAPTSKQRIESIRRMAAEGASDPEIGERLGLSKDAVNKIRRNHGIPSGKPQSVPGETVDMIRTMAGGGASDTEIGKTVGMSRSAVQAIRKRRGIEAGSKPQTHVHGTPSMYNSGCRCDECRACQRDRAKEQQAKRAAKVRAGVAVFEHGVSGYRNWGCRCDECSAAHARQCAAYDAHRREVDPESAAQRSKEWRDANRDHVRATNNQRFRDYQRKTIDRAAKHYQQWTSAELEVISRTDISVEEIALLLGRTWNAVQKQRQKMRDAERGKEPQEQQAGRTPSVQTHGLGGYRRGCRCVTCVEAKRKYRQDYEEKVKSATVPGARNARKEWTGPELEMAARDDLSVKEIARRLGRSYAAVSVIRHKIRHDPKTINFVGLARGSAEEAQDDDRGE